MKKFALALCAFLLASLVWSQDASKNASKPVTCAVPTVILRGESALADGKISVALPSWFDSELKSTGCVIQLTCKDGISPLSASGVANGTFTVTTNENGEPTQAFYWTVYADQK